MNSSEIHLALTHVPVILSLTGLAILAISWLAKNDTLTKTALYIFIVAGLVAVPVYLTGEPTEELVENIPGISEPAISTHEETAEVSFIIAGVLALLSIAALVAYRSSIARFIRMAMVPLGLVAAAAMVQTAHTGGLIRHTEINTAATAGGGSESNGGESGEEENEKRDGERRK